jgi:pyruvate kinase
VGKVAEGGVELEAGQMVVFQKEPIEPIYMPAQTSNTGFFQRVDQWLLEHQWAKEGDTVVFVVSEPITRATVTNDMVIHNVGEPI